MMGALRSSCRKVASVCKHRPSRHGTARDLKVLRPDGEEWLRPIRAALSSWLRSSIAWQSLSCSRKGGRSWDRDEEDAPLEDAGLRTRDWLSWQRQKKPMTTTMNSSFRWPGFPLAEFRSNGDVSSLPSSFPALYGRNTKIYGTYDAMMFDKRKKEEEKEEEEEEEEERGVARGRRAMGPTGWNVLGSTRGLVSNCLAHGGAEWRKRRDIGGSEWEGEKTREEQRMGIMDVPAHVDDADFGLGQQDTDKKTIIEEGVEKEEGRNGEKGMTQKLEEAHDFRDGGEDRGKNVNADEDKDEGSHDDDLEEDGVSGVGKKPFDWSALDDFLDELEFGPDDSDLHLESETRAKDGEAEDDFLS